VRVLFVDVLFMLLANLLILTCKSVPCLCSEINQSMTEFQAKRFCSFKP